MARKVQIGLLGVTIMVLSVLPVSGQVLEKPAPKEDTITVRAGLWILLRDSVCYIPRDTFLILDAATPFEIIHDYKSESFFDSLESKLKRKKWTSSIYDFLVQRPQTTPRPDELIESARAAFEPYAGRRIEQITFNQVDLLEGSVDDTSRTAQSLLGRTMNTFHTNTREKVLRRFVMFERGEQLNPDILADTERLLRSLSFIEDARIFVVPRPEDPEVVDVRIFTKDRFSIGVEGSLAGIGKFQAGVYDQNLMGLGIEMGHNFLFNNQEKPAAGYHGRLRFTNIGKSLITADVDYINTAKINEVTVRFDRGFFTPEIKWGGGIEIAHTNRYRQQLASDGIEIELPYSANYYDIWGGHSFTLPSEKYRTNLSFSLRYVGIDFKERPPVTAEENYFFHQRNFFLANLTFVQRHFYRSRNFTGFGDTEDIPIGFSVGLTGGYDLGEFYQRPYAGLDLSIGTWLGTAGYLGFNGYAAGFFRKKEWEDGLIGLKGIYFTPLIRLGSNWRFRQFFEVNYLEGIRRLNPGESLNLKSRIRNYPSGYPQGLSVITMNFESVLFAPWHLYGFKSAFFVFSDLACLAGRYDHHLINGDRFFASIGFGIRLRNRSLAFQTLELRLAYIPKIENYNSNWFVDFRSNDPDIFLNLRPARPAIPRFGDN